MKWTFTNGKKGKGIVRVLTLIWMENCITMWLGVIYDFKTINRKQGELPVRAPPACPATLLWLPESDMTPSWLEYTKTPPQQEEAHTLRLKNCLKLHFFIKTFSKI
jgi:hypothetical protein